MTQQRGNDRATIEICGCSNLARAESYRRQLSNALARVSASDQENERLRGEQRDDLDDYAVDELPKALRQLAAAEARAERAEADLVDAREFVRSNHARADRAERHADGLRRRCERAAVELRQVAEAHLYDGDTDQPINDGYHALYGVAAALSGLSQ